MVSQQQVNTHTKEEETSGLASFLLLGHVIFGCKAIISVLLLVGGFLLYSYNQASGCISHVEAPSYTTGPRLCLRV